MLQLEVLRAEAGDSLLLLYGDGSSSGLMLVDGGPGHVYSRVVRERLMELRDEWCGEEPLPIDMVVVSHIDDDHIHGIVDLSSELVQCREDRTAVPFKVGELWHNSFERTMRGVAPQVSQHLEAGVAPAEAVALAWGQPLGVECAAVEMASVGQGKTLRDNARRLGWHMNVGFADGLVVEGGGPTRQDTNRPRMTVIGPRAAELEALREEWERALASSRAKPAHEAALEIAACVDKSVANLSSIAMLAEYAGKTILFAGDARGDLITEGLRDVGLMTGPSVHVDVLKIPHHGSKHNGDEPFFRQVTADHYVISSDGSNGNPDIETLQWLLDARADDDFTLHINYDLPHVAQFVQQQKAGGREFRTDVTGETDGSVVITLA